MTFKNDLLHNIYSVVNSSPVEYTDILSVHLIDIKPTLHQFIDPRHDPKLDRPDDVIVAVILLTWL